MQQFEKCVLLICILNTKSFISSNNINKQITNKSNFAITQILQIKKANKTINKYKMNTFTNIKNKQTQFTPTLSTPETLHTRNAVPPNWTVVLCAII